MPNQNTLPRFLQNIFGKNSLDQHTRPASADLFPLDDPLLAFSHSPRDFWTLRDACEGVQIFGSLGSGKTSGSGQAIATAYLAAGFGGLVLTAKPDERELWEGYVRATGRERDLVIFSPDQPHGFNFLSYEMRRPGKGAGDTETLIKLFRYILAIFSIFRSSAAHHGKSHFGIMP